MQDQKKPDVTFRGVPVVFDDELPMAKAADPMQAFGNPLTGPLNAVPAGREVIVPGTALTVGAVARLENAAANLVAVANLYSEEAQRTFADPTFLPEPVVAAISKINGILAGPGPVALDMRPNSVEVHGDPVLHEKALLEARAREQRLDRSGADAARQLAMGMVDEATVHAALVHEEREGAHLNDVSDAFEQGKTQGWNAGAAETWEHGFFPQKEALRKEGFDAGVEQGLVDRYRMSEQSYTRGYDDGVKDGNDELLRMSLWAHLKVWWRSLMVKIEEIEVGMTNADAMPYWRNSGTDNADPPPFVPSPLGKFVASEKFDLPEPGDRL